MNADKAAISKTEAANNNNDKNELTKAKSMLKKRNNIVEIGDGIRMMNLKGDDIESLSLMAHGRVERLSVESGLIARKYFRIPRNGEVLYEILLKDGYNYEFQIKMDKFPTTFFGDQRSVMVKFWLKQRGKPFSEFSENVEISDVSSTLFAKFSIKPSSPASFSSVEDSINKRKVQFLSESDRSKWEYNQQRSSNTPNSRDTNSLSTSESPTTVFKSDDASPTSKGNWKLSFCMISGSVFRTMHLNLIINQFPLT